MSYSATSIYGCTFVYTSDSLVDEASRVGGRLDRLMSLGFQFEPGVTPDQVSIYEFSGTWYNDAITGLLKEISPQCKGSMEFMSNEGFSWKLSFEDGNLVHYPGVTTYDYSRKKVL